MLLAGHGVSLPTWAQDDSMAQVSPAATHEARLIHRLGDAQLDFPRRVAAAAELLRRPTQASKDILRTRLMDRNDVATQRVILTALMDDPQPPRDLAPRVLALLETADASLLPDLAAVLGRYDDHFLERDLTRLAGDDQTPASVRQGAILALGHQRTQNSAKLLMSLIDPAQPDHIRQAAFTALGQLACQPELGEDAAAWRQWWEVHQQLSPARWEAQLLLRFAHRAQQLERFNRQAVDRLVDAQRQLLRATPQADRPALLTAWLEDAIESLRLLAIQQIDQRSQAGEPIDAALRQGLLARLGDLSPRVRLAAARLLRNLRDEGGSRQRVAQAAAAHLTGLDETDAQVLRVYLLILTDTPVQEAVDRQIDLLRNVALREDAAGAIASAIDQNMVSPQDVSLLKRMLARLIPDDQPPEPKLIDLLGRIGGQDDWRRIALWMEHPRDRVRLAAARSWAQSDRPLSLLARYADDPLLLPIIIEAAYRRGQSMVTFMALVGHKPQQEQLAQAWQSALIAMAGRLPPQAVLAGEMALARREEPAPLRAAVIGAAVQSLEEHAAAHQAVPVSVRMSLHLRHVQLLLDAGNTDIALARLDRLDTQAAQYTPPQASQAQSLRLDLYAAMGDLDRALAQCDLILARQKEAKAIQGKSAWDLGLMLLNWADRAMDTGQHDQADRIAAYLQKQVGPLLADEHQVRLVTLQEAIAKLRKPAVTPDQPASSASAGSQPAAPPASEPPASSPSPPPAAPVQNNAP